MSGLCLALILSACASSPSLASRTKPQPTAPPESPPPAPVPETPEGLTPALASPEVNPWPAELQATCDPLSRIPPAKASESTRFALEHWKHLKSFVETTRSSREVPCVREFLARHLPLALEAFPPPDSPADLRAWSRALDWRDLSDPKPPNTYTVAPEPPFHLSAADLRELGPLVCLTPGCGAEARAALTTAIAGAEEHSRFLRVAEECSDSRREENCDPWEEPTAEELIGCENSHEKGAHWDLGDWRACVSKLVPSRALVPSDSFKLPAEGTLTTTDAGYSLACTRTMVLDLQTGVTLIGRTCERDRNGGTTRYTVVQSSAHHARVFALLTVLKRYLRSSPLAVSHFLIPAHLPERKKERTTSSYSYETRVTDVVYTKWTLTGVQREVRSGEFVYGDQSRVPEAALSKLEESQEVLCLKKNQRSLLRRLLAAWPSSAPPATIEEPALQRVFCDPSEDNESASHAERL